MSNSFIIAPQWIGDAVMTEPLLRRLRARGERLVIGAVPWVAPVYRAMPHVDDVIEFPFQHGGVQFKARRSIAKQVEGRFDTAYVLPNSLKSALLPFLAKIPKRVGYLGEARVGLLTHRLKNPTTRPPMVAFYSALSGDREGLLADQPQLQLPDQSIGAALDAQRLQRNGYYVFAPGAEFGPAKRWPAIHYTELARALDAPVVLLGSAKEGPLCDEITGADPKQITNLAGKTSLLDAFALIAASRATVSNDSGLMHVAAAFGVPQVAVFGSSSPRHTPPLNANAQVIWLKDDPSYQPPLDCAPCFERECPLGHTRCLVDITPERVAGLLST
ncbi:MAG: lipopolysaccharide heptosyltransferase II [Ramlibacter sp.]|nr:lipopolysaccharide heptosyltransferase II [Ramlibacter sp.]